MAKTVAHSQSTAKWLYNKADRLFGFSVMTIAGALRHTAKGASKAAIGIVTDAWSIVVEEYRAWKAQRIAVKELTNIASTLGANDVKNKISNIKSSKGFKFLFKTPNGRDLLDILKAQSSTHKNGDTLLQDVKSLARSPHVKLISEKLDKLSAVFGGKNNIPLGAIASSHAADVICKNTNKLTKLTQNLSLDQRKEMTTVLAQAGNPKVLLNSHKFFSNIAAVSPQTAIAIAKLPVGNLEAVMKNKGAAFKFIKANGFSNDVINFLKNMSAQECSLFLKNYSKLAKAINGSKNLDLATAKDLVASKNFATICEAAGGFWEKSAKVTVNLKSVLRHLEPSDRLKAFAELANASPKIIDALLGKDNLRTFAKELRATPAQDRLSKFVDVVQNGLPVKQQQVQQQTSQTQTPPANATTASPNPVSISGASNVQPTTSTLSSGNSKTITISASKQQQAPAPAAQQQVSYQLSPEALAKLREGKEPPKEPPAAATVSNPRGTPPIIGSFTARYVAEANAGRGITPEAVSRRGSMSTDELLGRQTSPDRSFTSGLGAERASGSAGERALASALKAQSHTLGQN